jgi:hypothetical protein
VPDHRVRRAEPAARLGLILTPFYGHRPDDRTVDLVTAHAAWLKARPIALACVCLTPQACKWCLKPLTDVLGESIVWAGDVRGRIVLKRLDAADRETIGGLSRSGHLPLQAIDTLDRAATMETTLRVHLQRRRALPAE